MASGWDLSCVRLEAIAAEPMDHYSFHGPYAYRWVNDVPVERIHLRNGERRDICIGARNPVPPAAPEPAGGVRALMAAWN